MPLYADVAVNIPRVTGVFSYQVPVELELELRRGHLVLVPFGKQTVQGVVFNISGQTSVPETRKLIELVDHQAVLTDVQIQLAEKLSVDCLAPLAACLGLMLPPGLEQKGDLLFTLSGRTPDDLTTTQSRLLHLLERRGSLRGQQIDHSLPRTNWRPAMRSLQQRGAVSAQPVLPRPRVHPKTVRTARLSGTPEEARAALPQLGRAGSQALARRQAILRFLMQHAGPVEAPWIYAETGGKSEDLLVLSQRGLIVLGESQTWRDPLGQANFQPFEAPVLTHDQQTAWEQVKESLDAATRGEAVQPLLLHGVTGSGKTEIYLQAVRYTLELGRQAIVLVPEIALTPQTVRRFAGRFPDQVGLVHSGLSQGERYDTWRRARQGELGLVVGPRSALFTPFERLGLIILDESHDDTYYQWENLPHYHSRQAAVTYSRLLGAVCLMGTATPDIGSMYLAKQGSYRYLHLPERIIAHRQAVQDQIKRISKRAVIEGSPVSRFHPLEAEAEFSELPPVRIVDMRAELKSGNRSIFSQALQEGLGKVLEQEQQAILFLNRRGSATYVFCRDCGHTMKCPRCELPLTFHEAEQTLRCHYCGYERKNPLNCPQCGSQRIRHYGTGTQKVESEVQGFYPQARTLRWDYETTRKKGAHEAILSQFIAHGADVLVGTQMLAKGLDLPLVTLVGVVLADVGLSLPDYRAGERLFQVLTQVAGRAGRSPLGGEVILQTFQPENYVIQAAAKHAYAEFYQKELGYYRQLQYPPFTQLVRLEYRHHDNQRAEQTARQLAARMETWLQEEGRRATSLIGPAPCFFSRMAGFYRWQLILKGADPAAVLRGRTLDDWRIEINPPSLL